MAKGLKTFLPEDFAKSEHGSPQSFDSLLIAHVLEHVPAGKIASLLETYLPYVRSKGKVIVITPQEKGFSMDPTHQTFLGFKEITELFQRVGVEPSARWSFPFPRFLGSIFPYNEFVSVGVVVR